MLSLNSFLIIFCDLVVPSIFIHDFRLPYVVSNYSINLFMFSFFKMMEGKQTSCSQWISMQKEHMDKLKTDVQDSKLKTILKEEKELEDKNLRHDCLLELNHAQDSLREGSQVYFSESRSGIAYGEEKWLANRMGIR